MDILFSHPGFRLIFIDDNGNMSLVTPLENKDVEEDIMEKGYRCISHLWGIATKWEDHPVGGVTWGVDVREEKRAKLLQIFNHYRGYWWMDVFCTNQEDINKPLDVMGDIYKMGFECVCLLDYRPDLKSPHTKLLECPDDEEYLVDCPKYSRYITSEQQKHKEMSVDYLSKVAQCKWFQRVWTVQEWSLPLKVYYTRETLGNKLYIIDAERLFGLPGNVYDTYVMEPFYNNVNRWNAFLTKFKSTDLADTLHHLQESRRMCINQRDYYYGISGMLGVPLTNNLTFDEVEKEFFAYYKTRGICITRLREDDGFPSRFYDRLRLSDA